MITDVQARNGELICVGDIVQTVQDTIFKVVEHAGSFYLKDEDGGLWDLHDWMQPNIWVIAKADKEENIS